MTSPDAHRIAAIGRLLAAPTRAELLVALLGGTAHTPSELARHLRLAASTVSEHLAALVDAGLVVVEPQGRNRYVRLADQQVAQLLERLATFDVRVGHAPTPRVPAELAHARSCYGHLAGVLGVRLFDSLLASGRLHRAADSIDLTDTGAAFLTAAGVAIPPGSRSLARPCLDWSQRTHHLAGRLGDGLLTHFLQSGWLARSARHPRALHLTTAGRTALPAVFDMEVR